MQIAPSNRFDTIASRDLSILHQDVQVLNGAFGVGVQLADPPVAVMIDFDEQTAVNVVVLGNQPGALLDVVALGDCARGVIQFGAFALHGRHRPHGQLSVGEDAAFTRAVRFKPGERVHRRG